MIKLAILTFGIWCVCELSSCAESKPPQSKHLQQSLPQISTDVNINTSARIQDIALVDGSWSAPSVLGSESADSEFLVELAVSGQGDLLAAWGNPYGKVDVGVTPQAQIKTANTAQWVTASPFTADPGNTLSNVKFYTNTINDVSNDSYATWWSKNDSGYFMSHYSGAGSWDAPVELGTQSIYAIEVDTQGNATILWLDYSVIGNVEIHIRKYLSASGLTHMYTLVRNEVSPAQQLDISHLTLSSKLDLTKIVWNEKTKAIDGAAAASSIFSADFIDNIGWQPVTKIDAQLPGLANPSALLNLTLVEDPQLNRYQLVLVSFNPLDFNLSYQLVGMTLENEIWSAPESLDFNDIEGEVIYSTFAKNSQGSLIALWVEKLKDITGPVLVIRCRRYIAGQGWGSLEVISTPIPVKFVNGSSANQIDLPRISINEAADILVAWHVSDTVNSNLWVNHYSQALGWGFPELVATANSGAFSDFKAVVNPDGHPALIWQQQVIDANGESKSIVVVEHVL